MSQLIRQRILTRTSAIFSRTLRSLGLLPSAPPQQLDFFHQLPDSNVSPSLTRRSKSQRFSR